VQLSGGQSTHVDQAFAPPLLAVVTDANDNTIAGAPINFSVVPASNGASATLSAPSAISDDAGRASVTVTANSIAGFFALRRTQHFAIVSVHAKSRRPASEHHPFSAALRKALWFTRHSPSL